MDHRKSTSLLTMEAHLHLDPACGILSMEIRRAMAGDRAGRGERMDRACRVEIVEEEDAPTKEGPSRTHEAEEVVEAASTPTRSPRCEPATRAG